MILADRCSEKRDQSHQHEVFEMLNSIKTRRHLALSLGFEYRRFMFVLYRSNDSTKYRSFDIPKRRGGVRNINAPTGSILRIQRSLKPHLDNIYKPRPSVYGFVKGGGIVKNAQRHVNKRWVLNIDLESFFDSINFGRIRGRLLARPYELDSDVATTIAHAACYQKRLPQGGAISPVLSNIVCDRLDSELSRLCRKYRCTYTRYVDDITISCNTSRFPKGIAYFAHSGSRTDTALGDELKAVIYLNGFKANPEKTRLQTRHIRQEVTGIVVNEKTNVPRSFTRQVRAMLHAWEIYGLDNASKEHFEKWRPTRGRLPDYEANDFDFVVRGKIEFMRQVRGENDKIFRKFAQRYDRLTSRKKFNLPPDEIVEALTSATWMVDFTHRAESVRRTTPWYRRLFRHYFSKMAPDNSSTPTSTGTAFFCDGIGWITCAHCVGDDMWIFHPKNEALRFRVKAKVLDKTADVAILEEIDPVFPGVRPKHPLKPATSSTIKQAKVGTNLVVAGYPANLSNSCTVNKRAVTTTFDRSKQPLFATDKTVRLVLDGGIVEGMSGGPVVTVDGLVVGIAANGAGSKDHLAQSEVVPLTALLKHVS